MPEDEFEIYLTLLAKTLRLKDGQRDAISAELRDHLEARLEELTIRGMCRREAIHAALAEFGDASALANDLTKTNPARVRTRRHLMQTTFGTVLACAAVTFLVMTLTPTNKDGAPNQPRAAAQPGGGFGEFDDGGLGRPGDVGGLAGGTRGDAFGGGRGAMGAGGGFSAAVQVKLDLAIHVVDCTEILRPERDRGDLLQRTAALANAVQQTVATVNEHGGAAIRVQPFEEFLIITATEGAFDEAAELLNQIADHVARRAQIQDAEAERRQALERKQLEELELQRLDAQEKRLQLEAEYERLALAGRQLEEQGQQLSAQREQLRTQFGPEHAEVLQVTQRLEDTAAHRDAVEEQKLQLRIQIERLQTQQPARQLGGRGGF